MDEPFAARFRHALAHPAPDATGVLIVNLGAIRRNYRRLRDAAPGAETAGVIKANAYGLGVNEVLAALKDEGCKTFFVATPKESMAVPALAAGVTIFVLDGFLTGGPPMFRSAGVCPVLNSFDEIEEWICSCRSWGAPRPAAIHVDTGMTRLGLPAEEVNRLVQMPGALAYLDLRLIMSHLACADDPGHPKNERQRNRFEQLAGCFPGVPRSLANSGGIFLGPQFHYDLTRPGIALYGGRPASAGANPMEPVFALFGRIAQVRWAEAGETMGYGATQTLKRRTKIATVTAGYADGFFRSVSASDLRDGPPGYIGDYRLPLLGRVSMDLITFDATDVPDELVKRGGFVELLGERVTVDDFSAFAGTISYEVLTSLGRRYHRVYVDE